LGKYEIVTTTGTPRRLTLKLIEALCSTTSLTVVFGSGFTGTLASS
jgi:hypothetical protein